MTLKTQGTKYIFLWFFLAFITFIAHYWHYNNLGLYEDDYFLVGHPMSMNLDEFSEFMKWHVLNFGHTEGRPLLYIIEFTVGFIGNLLQDFHSLYLINYLVILLSNILVYKFLKSIWNQPVFIVTGTLAFALFPADTNHAYLTHICLYVSVIFLLLAFLSYFSNHKLISYLLIFASLFCYETVFPLFITAPLLKSIKNKWDKKIFKETFKHALIMVGMLAIVFIARKLTGEARINELSLITLLLNPIYQMIIGPVVSLSMFLYRPAQTLLNLNREILILTSLCFWAFILLLSNLKIQPENNFGDQDNIKTLSPVKKLVILGLTLLILAYPFNFTRVATQINGRDSRVHMTAAIGASILVGLLCFLIINLAKSKISTNITNGALAIFLSLLVGFGLTVQQENQKSWQYQQAFWTNIIHLCPDIMPDTIILVDAPHLNMGKHLHSFRQWGVPMTLREIYKFPSTWARLDELLPTSDRPRWYFWRRYTLYPKVYMLNHNWQETIVKQDKFDFDRKNKAFDYFLQWEPSRLIDSSNIILLEEKNEQLIRRSEPLTINNQIFEFKTMAKTLEKPVKKGVLYNYLIKQDDTKLVSFFK